MRFLETVRADGPLADVLDAFAGYLLYEADDLDAAVDLASRIPAAQMGGTIEIRPIVKRKDLNPRA